MQLYVILELSYSLKLLDHFNSVVSTLIHAGWAAISGTGKRLIFIVVWPTMICCASWSKCRHMAFIIIEWSAHHDRLCIIRNWYRVTWPCTTKLAWLMSINMRCVTAVLIIKKATVSKSQNVKDSSPANKYLRKIKINLRTKVEVCIWTYSNADVICYSATWRME